MGLFRGKCIPEQSDKAENKMNGESCAEGLHDRGWPDSVPSQRNCCLLITPSGLLHPSRNACDPCAAFYIVSLLQVTIALSERNGHNNHLVQPAQLRSATRR